MGSQHSVGQQSVSPAGAGGASTASPAPQRPGMTGWSGRLDVRQIGLPLAVLAMIVLFAVRSDVFFTVSNWQNVGLQAAALACVAFGQAFVVLTAGIDLSVGSMVALSSVVAALFMGSGIAIAVVAALAIGVVVGLVNGLV